MALSAGDVLAQDLRQDLCDGPGTGLKGRRADLFPTWSKEDPFASGQGSHLAQAQPALTWGGLAGGHPARGQALNSPLPLPHIPGPCQTCARPPETSEGLSLESRTFPWPVPRPPSTIPTTVAQPHLHPAGPYHSPYLSWYLMRAGCIVDPRLDGC